MRDFGKWLKSFKSTIANYGYYVNFDKIYSKVEKYKIELNILNSLIGSKDIETEFVDILNKYPKTIECLPIMLAVRQSEISVLDNNKEKKYYFNNIINSVDDYITFMRETGLFELLSNRLIINLIDYITGVETGLDSNGRKNRGGHLMEDLVEKHLIKADVEYYKEMKTKQIEKKWGCDLSRLSNDGKTIKKFDFVVRCKDIIYAIETNYYNSGGSKINETARSYKMIALESKQIDDFVFVWITDGKGWRTAANNLEETFDVLDTLYNINDLENGKLNDLFNK